MKKQKNEIGAKIRIAREAVNISQTELALRIGKTKAHISHLESGKGGYRPETLQPIAEVLKKPLHYFYEPIENTTDDRRSVISDDKSEYNNADLNLTPEMKRIIRLLQEHPDAQRNVMSYLLSYYQGGKGHLSRLGGIIDVLDPGQIEELIPLLCRKLREGK